MGTVETRSSKTLVSLSEPDKTKPLKDVTESSAVEASQENGDRVSGEPKITGKEILSGEKSLVEENGVSLDDNDESQQNGKDGSLEAPIGDVSDDEDGEIEESGGEGHDFRVGDFVWGKIRSHPWWPGQVFDPATASDRAAKMRHRGRVLVAYFGDGTFAWCKPSQLKLFEENFEEMSRQSTMKAFVAAVHQAAEEIGRVLELKMICSCVPEQGRDGLGRLVSDNAGIKEGVLVPEGEIRKLSDVLAEPSELLAELKHFAEGVHGTDALVVRVLRSRVSAFYRGKGGRESPQYRDPVPVCGLEDRGKSSVKVPAQGPFEDWLPSSIDVQLAKAEQPLLQSCPTTSESKRAPRRKQRSIADLIAREETSLEQKQKSSGTKKRKSKEEITVDDDSTLTSLSGKAKKANLSSGSRVKASSGDISGLKKGNTGETKEESKEGVASKGRKTKKKSLSKFENDGGESKKGNEDGSISRKLRLRSGSLKVDDSSSKPQLEESPSFRERKKSKYLSPPFTNGNSSKRKRDAESAKDSVGEGGTTPTNQNVGPKSSESNSETHKNKVSSEPGLEYNVPHGSSPNIKTPIQNPDKVVDHKKADVPTDEWLSEVRSAAASPLTRKEKKSVDMVVDFMSVFRDSTYRSGSNYKSYKKSQSRTKRKKSKVEPGSNVEDPKQPVEKSPETKTEHGGLAVDKSKGKKAVERVNVKSSGRQKRKKEAPTPEAKAALGKESPQVVKENAKPAVVVASFGPGSQLPTKAELIRMYCKYGKLDEDKTDMLYNNFCALISFRNSSNAESAYKDSLAASPFRNATVDFTLRYNSATKSKRRELIGVSRKKAATTPKSPAKPQANGSEESDLKFIKRKLETVSSMLEETGGRISPTMKSKLKGEIKSMSEKVNTMIGSSSQK